MLMRLDLETHPYHDAADAPWQDLLAPGTTRNHYVEQLVVTYGFEGPLEAAFVYTPHLSSVIQIRLRSGLIARDLLELGMSAGQIARIPQCPIAPFASLAEALGWMYVAERGTLLHERVRGRLSARVPGTADACVYLAAQSTSIGARWHELGGALDRAAYTPRIADSIVSAAHEGFRTYQEWFAPSRQARAGGA